jgi:hypothetical protein
LLTRNIRTLHDLMAMAMCTGVHVKAIYGWNCERERSRSEKHPVYFIVQSYRGGRIFNPMNEV